MKTKKLLKKIKRANSALIRIANRFTPLKLYNIHKLFLEDLPTLPQ